MVKRIISVIAAAAMLTPPAAFASFNDVNEYSQDYEMITELEVLGIVDGDGNGNFNPYDTVTRAEFTKLLVAALGEEDVAKSLTGTRFSDCKDHWAVGYIETGVADGFINGYDDTHFGPDDNVTYAQAVKMLVAAVGYTTYAENSGGWQTGYLKYGNSTGITKGVTDIKNDDPLNRLQTATLVYNALDVPLATIDAGSRLVIRIHNGKSETDYETLLTDRHDAYRVKGRITGTSRSQGGIQKGYVNFHVEVSDNFDGTAYSKSNAETFPMKVGSSDMTGFLFIYSEALVHKDENDEYEILIIKAK